MVTILKKGRPLRELKKKLEQVKIANKRSLDAAKYSGKVKFTKDPVEIQKELRDEWE